MSSSSNGAAADAANSARRRGSADAGESILDASAAVAPGIVDPSRVLMAVLWGTVAIAWLAAPPQADPQLPLPTALHTIDPNRAAWWELATLPRIGRASAMRLIEYRELAPGAAGDAGPAFRSAADLSRVPTWGPKTVQRVAHHLRFDTDSASAN